MTDGKLICRVCGKEYDPCRTANSSGSFRWQDVACSKEHGVIYLARIEESRSPKRKRLRPEVTQAEPAPVVNKEDSEPRENDTAIHAEASVSEEE